MLLGKSMPMFIRRGPSAIFAFTFINTLFTSAAIANRTLMALSYTIEFNPLPDDWSKFKQIAEDMLKCI